MATIAAVITDRLSTYSVELSATRLETVLLDNDLTGTDTYTKAKGPAVKTALVSVLTDLLAMPDVTEGGYSVKWDRAQVAAYCNSLRGELGLLDSSASTLSDRSYLW